jgi:hypothetical protein
MTQTAACGSGKPVTDPLIGLDLTKVGWSIFNEIRNVFPLPKNSNGTMQSHELLKPGIWPFCLENDDKRVPRDHEFASGPNWATFPLYRGALANEYLSLSG